MKLKEIKNMDKEGLLGLLGLQTKHTFNNQLLRSLGTFGVGLLVGAGIALLFAPKAGSELRRALHAKLHREGKSVEANGAEDGGAGRAASRQV